MYILDFSIITISSSLSSAHTISHASRFSKARCSPAQKQEQEQEQEQRQQEQEQQQEQPQGHKYISIRAHTYISVSEHTHIYQYQGTHIYISIRAHAYCYRATMCVRILLYRHIYISIRAHAYCYIAWGHALLVGSLSSLRPRRRVA